MLIGFNNDIEYKNKMYHIQTEDHGVKDGQITTTVFFSGQILDSQKISYLSLIKDISSDEERDKNIRKLMVKQHKKYYERLFSGEYDQNVEKLINQNLKPSIETKQIIPKTQTNIIPQKIPSSIPQLKSNPALPANPKLSASQNRRPSITLKNKTLQPPTKTFKHCYCGVKWPPNDPYRLDILVSDALDSI